VRTKRQARRPAVEQLEDRCLLSSTLQAISLVPATQPPSDTAAGTSLHPAVSAGGRYVVFESSAPNLFGGQTGGSGVNVILRDQVTGQVSLVGHVNGDFSQTPTTPCGSAGCAYHPLIGGVGTDDGRYVVYNTTNPDIAGTMTGPAIYPVVMLYDRTTRLNVPISLSCNESAGSEVDAISANGNFIVFHSTATDLLRDRSMACPAAPSPTGPDQLFLYDRVQGKVFLISHLVGDPATPAGASAASYVTATVADDGTVAYVSQTADLVTGSPSGVNVYLYFPAGQTNQLISTAAESTDTADGGPGMRALISADGSTVVYTSRASDVVPNEPNPDGSRNVFRYRCSPTCAPGLTGTTTLVSGSGGSATATGNGNSGAFGFGVAVSRDGNFVAFTSEATDLVSEQTGNAADPGDAFLYDAAANRLTLLSGVGGSSQAGAGGVPTLDASGISYNDLNLLTDAGSGVLTISDDGGRVAYLSDAGNVVPGQNGPVSGFNVFLYDRTTGKSALVSGSGGSPTTTAEDSSGGPVLSADGTALAFPSLAVDLAPGVFDANGSADVFTYTPGNTGPALVSRAAFQVQRPGDSYSTSVSADGRYTVFTSAATNLVPNQVTANVNQNIFVYDKETNAVALVNHVPGLFSTTGDGGIGVDSSERPSADLQPVISADGNLIAFASLDLNLVPGESFPSGGRVSGYQFIYLFDNRPGTTHGAVTLVSHLSGAGNRSTLFQDTYATPVISADGRFIAFTSTPPSQTSHGDIMVYDRLNPDTITDIFSPDQTADRMATNPSISDDGRFVSYLDGGNVYVFDRSAGASTLVSHTAASLTTAAGGSSAPALGHDGTAIAFVSTASDLVANQTASPFSNVFLYRNDGSGVIRLVSGINGSATTGGNGDSDSPAIDGDGSDVAYRSDATNLVSGQTGPTSNVFEFDTQTGIQTLVSHAAVGSMPGAVNPTVAAGGVPQPTPDAAPEVVIDGDGHLISYVSTAGNLIPGQEAPTDPSGNPVNNVKNVFVWLRQTGANILASGNGGSPTVTGDADSDFPLLTRDSFPGFSSRARLLGVGGSSVAYINTLVDVALLAAALADGSPAGSLIGTLTVTSLLAGQYRPAVYRLEAGAGDNALFHLGLVAGGAAPLLTQFNAGHGVRQLYRVLVHVDVGFGDQAFLLQVFGPARDPGPPPPPDRGISVGLASKKGRKKKPARLVVRVFFADTGTEKGEFVSPFQKPAFRSIAVRLVDSNGDGVPDQVVVTARKGKKRVSATFSV
jgi:hypothetical protein